MEGDLNFKTYKCRMWPFAPSSYALISWSQDRLGRTTTFDCYIVIDSDDDKYEAFREVVPRTLSLYANEAPDFEFWLSHAEKRVKRSLQEKVDDAWVKGAFPGHPPKVSLQEIRPLELLELRFQGRGTAGLESAAKNAHDPSVRDFAKSLLGVRPIQTEELE